jgi:hypothetical protein
MLLQENSLQKLLLKFKRDATIRSKVMDLLSRSSGHVSGTTRSDVVSME